MSVGTGNNTCLCSRAAADKTNKCRDWKIQVLAGTDHAISDGSLELDFLCVIKLLCKKCFSEDDAVWQTACSG
jgi:hypothetical protein